MTAKPTPPLCSHEGVPADARFGPVVRLPLGRVVGGTAGLGLLAGVLAGILGAFAGTGFDILGVALGMLAVFAGIGMSTMIFAGANRRGRQVFAWATLIMAGSMVRLLISLAVAFGLFFANDPAKAPFFAAFLVGSLAALAAETLLTREALLNARPSRSSPSEPSSTEPA
jgi:uncharacterized protein (DUF486 family)